MQGPNTSRGHAIKMLDIHVDDIGVHADAMESIINLEHSGVIVRQALPPSMVDKGRIRLEGDNLDMYWGSPNAGMVGGEVRTIGEAATPCFTSFEGPSNHAYRVSAAQHEVWTKAIFEDANPTPILERVFSALFRNRSVGVARFTDGVCLAPYNYRALDPGVQIYAHHDNHYALPIYEELDKELDRATLMSWFVTLQPAEMDGELIIYGLWGSDPNPPLLPTRFLDIDVLENEFERYVARLNAGDLVIFDSGHHVHRVSSVRGERSRFTMGGFLTADQASCRLAFWS